MGKATKEEQKIILEKLKQLKIDIENVPEVLKIEKKVKYKNRYGLDIVADLYYEKDIEQAKAQGGCADHIEKNFFKH